MKTEDQLDAEVARAGRAQRILDDDLVKDAIKAIRDQIRQDFENSPIDNDRARLVARLKLDCMTEFVLSLQAHMQTGKLAQEELSLIEKAKRALRVA